MIVIHVLGTGCQRCAQLKENVQEAVALVGGDYEIREVRDIDEIVEFGVMTTPAVVVDGEISIQGKVATVEEIVAVLK
ncbi:MAG: thioredoxin family protein [Thermoguttaceae bacterium]